MSKRVFVSVGGVGPEVSIALATDSTNIIVKRFAGKEGLAALDRFISDLTNERNWLAAEVDRDGIRRC